MLWEAFLIGARDSLNPLSLSLILLFMIAMNLWAFTLKRVLVFCWFTFLGFVVSHAFLFSGLFYASIKSDYIWKSFRMACLPISIILIATGVINFFDWVHLKKESPAASLLCKFSYPEKLKNDQAASFSVYLKETHDFVWIFFMAVVSFLIGVVISTFLFMWPQSYYAYVLVMDTVSNHKDQNSFYLILIYAVGLGLPYLFIMASRVAQVQFSSVVMFCDRNLSIIKIILSAVCLALGLTLGVFVFK